MKTKEIKTEKPVKVSDQELLSLVAEKLKGRILFPHRFGNAKILFKDNASFVKK